MPLAFNPSIRGGLAATNTVAYFEESSVAKKESFLTLTPNFFLGELRIGKMR
jgi:hypothetical protein